MQVIQYRNNPCDISLQPYAVNCAVCPQFGTDASLDLHMYQHRYEAETIDLINNSLGCVWKMGDKLFFY